MPATRSTSSDESEELYGEPESAVDVPFTVTRLDAGDLTQLSAPVDEREVRAEPTDAATAAESYTAKESDHTGIWGAEEVSMEQLRGEPEEVPSGVDDTPPRYAMVARPAEPTHEDHATAEEHLRAEPDTQS